MQLLNKQGLYAVVSQIRMELGIRKSSYPLHIRELLEARIQDIRIGELDIRTRGLHGMVNLGNTGAFEPDVIILNVNRKPEEQNFDCSHEFLHTRLHRGGPSQTFHCYAQAMPNQDSYVEWQANEGAAELVVPWRLLLPMLDEYRDFLDSMEYVYDMKRELAYAFNVSPGMIEMRFESLMYEIDQYLDGTPVGKIEVMSRTKQAAQNLSVKSINQRQGYMFLNPRRMQQ